MSSTIRRGFAGIVTQGSPKFKFLDKLQISEDQQLDGAVLINHKSAVYLVQTAEQVLIYYYIK